MSKKVGNWFSRHKILSSLLVVLLVGILVGAFSNGSSEKSVEQPAASEESSRAVEAELKGTSGDNPESAKPTETTSQRSAVSKAKSYIRMGGFSRDGLVEQLEYEQFSAEDAAYGADNSGADWNEQAEKKAKSYMSMSGFSRGGLIDQLIYEKFTPEQAEHGANAVGL